MVKSAEVKKLMLKYFPNCPICLTDKGYDVLGADNDAISCKNCSATWKSEDFIKSQELTKLMLVQNPTKYDITGKIQRRKYYSTDFWLNWREKWRGEQQKDREEELKKLENDDSLIPCPICKSKMVHTEVKLRTGGWNGYWQLFPFGSLGELAEELMPVEVHVCMRCGKIEFMAPERTRQKLIERQ